MPRVEHGPDDLTIGLGYLARQAEAYPWAAAVDAEVERLRAALRDMLPGIDNLRGYRCAEQRAFLAHVESIERRVTAALSEPQQPVGGLVGHGTCDECGTCHACRENPPDCPARSDAGVSSAPSQAPKAAERGDSPA